MKGPNYDKALILAQNDPEILDQVHEIIMKDGLSEVTYAQVFVLLFYVNQKSENRLSCTSSDRVWKKGKQTLSDVKLFSYLSQCCELIRSYVLASWENCVFSAWCPKKEVIKAEKDMDVMETMARAKNIISQAAALMPNDSSDSRIDWGDDDDSGAT